MSEALEMIVVVRDPTTTRMLRSNLARWGFEATWCDDGIAAWEALQRHAAPDLLLLDWNAPGMSGIDLCRAMRSSALHDHRYVLLLAEEGSAPDIVAAFDARVDDYLTRPLVLAALKERLERATRRIRAGQGARSVSSSHFDPSAENTAVECDSPTSSSHAGRLLGRRFRVTHPLRATETWALWEARDLRGADRVAVRISAPARGLRLGVGDTPEADLRSHMGVRDDEPFEVLDFGVTGAGLPYVVMTCLDRWARARNDNARADAPALTHAPSLRRSGFSPRAARPRSPLALPLPSPPRPAPPRAAPPPPLEALATPPSAAVPSIPAPVDPVPPSQPDATPPAPTPAVSFDGILVTTRRSGAPSRQPSSPPRASAVSRVPRRTRRAWALSTMSALVALALMGAASFRDGPRSHASTATPLRATRAQAIVASPPSPVSVAPPRTEPIAPEEAVTTPTARAVTHGAAHPTLADVAASLRANAPQAARGQLLQMLRARANQPTVIAKLASVYALLGDHELASAAALVARRAGTVRAPRLTRLATTLANAGDRTGAIATLRLALQVAPDAAVAQRALSRLRSYGVPRGSGRP